MQKHKRAQVLAKQASLHEIYPEIENMQDSDISGVRQITTDIISAVVQHVQKQTINKAPSLSDELPNIVKNALQEVALEKKQSGKQLASDHATMEVERLSNEPNLDLTANLKEKKQARQSVTLKIANQCYMLSSDSDVDYMQAIAKEANLLLREVKKQLPHGDKQSMFVLALLNVLDEKANMTIKYNEQSELLQQTLNLTSELTKRKAVLERKIQNYKQKLADLAEVFTDISERFSNYKSDSNFNSENFQKLLLQVLDCDEADNSLANFSQLSIEDCLHKGRNN